MSSFGGTNVSNEYQGTQPALQLAPPEGDGPDFATLKKGFEETIANLQSWLNQCTENYNIRYALWPGQSADGRKHAREGAKIDPTPWDNASDLQVFLTDNAINSKVALLWVAFQQSSVSATPTEGNDIRRAKIVSSFVRWLKENQIPDIYREADLLANYIYEMGLGAVGVFWEDTQEKVLATVTLDALSQQFPALNITEAINADEMADDLCALFEEQYGCTHAKAKKILSSLRMTGKATVPTLGRVKSRPVVRAFDLNHNLFIPQDSTDLETAAAIYRVEYFSAEQLRSFVHTADWDEAWVEAAIERCRGQLITLTNNEYNQPISRSFMYQEQRFTNKIGVCFAYQRLSDEDGYAGIYCTIFNPQLTPDDQQPGYAKYGLLGYADGKYPFVLFRREHLSRKLHDSRGIPEPGKPLQQQIKVHKDSTIDAASMNVLPPIFYPQGRPPLRWGAGARIPERRQGEYHFGDRPGNDQTTQASLQQLTADFNEYNGFVSQESDPTFASLKNKKEVSTWLEKWGEVFAMVWSRYKQYGSETVFFRVVGVQTEEPIEFHKGQEDEEFDFNFTFDIASLDEEKQQKKLEALAKVLATFNQGGQADYSQALEIAVNSIDPAWASRLLLPANAGQQKIVQETQQLLTQAFAGVDVNIDLNAPPQLVLQIIQNYMQSAPDVQQRYSQDPAFKARIDKLVKQSQFQITQKQQNSVIGRYGAGPV